jgi:uncharacterized phage-like protein YoqJ
VEELRQHVYSWIIFWRQLLKRDPAFKPNSWGGESTDKIKYTHANIILTGQFKGNENNWLERNNNKNLLRIRKAEYIR